MDATCWWPYAAVGFARGSIQRLVTSFPLLMGSVCLGEKQGFKAGVIQTTDLGKTSASWQTVITWAGFRKTEVTKPCFSLQWEIQRNKSMLSCKRLSLRKRRK